MSRVSMKDEPNIVGYSPQHFKYLRNGNQLCAHIQEDFASKTSCKSHKVCT
jgi:hypothetical protein